MKLGRFVLAALCLFSLPAVAQEAKPIDARLAQIHHLVVIYLENHSFDNLYGGFPGAEGLSRAEGTEIQVNDIGLPFQTLPPVLDAKKGAPDTRFPADLPNQPFNIVRYIGTDETTSDMIHRFYQEQAEIDGGQMDKYVLYGGAGALPMGYYDGSSLPLWSYAARYTLGDHMFHAAFGGSFLNHFWLICACTPKFPNAPDDIKASISPDGQLVKDGAVTPDGNAVNTLEPVAGPHRPGLDAAHLLPLQRMPTIGDRLDEKGVSWAWYAGGYNNAAAGHSDELFEVHHQPFLYFANFALGTPGAKAHLRDEADLLKAIETDTLPAVSFWKPIGEDDEHPGYTNVQRGDRHTAEMLKKIESSSDWSHTLVIVTYDENGGQWDHVAPPHADVWGPGTRVPLMIVSPFAKTGFVDKTVYDTTSILALIEQRFDLKPLGDRDAKASPFLNALTVAADPAIIPCAAGTECACRSSLIPIRGCDDALAVLLAFASPEIDVRGISTIMGNTQLPQVTENALKICELAGRQDIPVHAGCARPMLQTLDTAEMVHGRDAMAELDLPKPSIAAQPRHAVDWIVDTVMAEAAGSLTLCALGPLTNLAAAIVKERQVATRLREIVVMGGSFFAGGNSNEVPVAESNIVNDPHAARIVFRKRCQHHAGAARPHASQPCHARAHRRVPRPGPHRRHGG